MKRTLTIATMIVAVAAMSCNKNGEPIAAPAGDAQLELRVCTKSVAQTRAGGSYVADTEAERKVNSLDIFLFNSSTGALEAYKSVSNPAQSGETGALTVSNIRVSNTTVDIYAIANAPADFAAGIPNRASLIVAESDFSDNAADSFVMQGKLASSVNVAAIEAVNGTKTVTTPLVLERIANKATVGTLVKNFESPSIQAETVKLAGVYLINANKSTLYLPAASAPFDVKPTAGDGFYWNPSSTFAENSLITRTYASGSEPVIADGDGTMINLPLYFYPNSADESASAAVEDYVSKVVLHVMIGSEGYWYPIAIKQLAASRNRNLAYAISSVTLRRPGNPDNMDPNAYIDETAAEFAISVEDWVSADVTGSYNGWMD